MTIQASNGTGAGGSGSIIFQTAPVAASSSTANVLATAMTITPSARVGIGSTSPAQLLDVASKFQVDTNGNILKINNIATSFPASQGAASTVLTNNGSGVLTWSNSTVNVTTTASATVGQKIMTDSSGGAFTITLPASAILGDQIEIFDATDSWTANNITLGRNGLNINGVAADFVLNVSGSYVRLIYYTAGQGWRTYP
jgi:hypothetical protein